jgi:archaellum component FlaC
MEALLEREGKVENWNDDRLDELNQTMKEGFAKSDREMKEGFARLEQGMKEGFERVDKRFEQVDKRFEQVDKRFEKLDERFFRFMIVMLVIGGGMISALMTTQI